MQVLGGKVGTWNWGVLFVRQSLSLHFPDEPPDGGSSLFCCAWPCGRRFFGSAVAHVASSHTYQGTHFFLSGILFYFPMVFGRLLGAVASTFGGATVGKW